jgi:hypothetical protein
MASANTLQVIENGYRNVVIRATQISDGTDGEAIKIYDASSGGVFGVAAPGGRIVYPGIFSSIVALDYDVQDMKLALRWEASVDQDVLALGSAPENFDWRSIGGLKVPTGLAGATGSITAVSLGPNIGATYTIIISIRKRIPQT